MSLRAKAVEVVKGLTPPVVISLARRLHMQKRREASGSIDEYANVFSGDFESWESAKRQSEGYDSPRLLDKIIEANREVAKPGPMRFERDSIIFDVPQTLPSLNCYLLLAYALRDPGREFTVLDYGGSLGTVYRQFRYVTHDTVPCRWIIVEQPRIAVVGAAEFATEGLSFISSTSWNPTQEHPDVVVISSVLEVVDRPLEVLAQLNESGARFLLLDRTPMWNGDRDVLTVCVAGKRISGSYPCWLFSHDRLMALLASDWELLGEWDALGTPIKFEHGTATYRGQCWRRRQDERAGDAKCLVS